MNDKRRKARVQGGWASPASQSNCRSDRNKPKIPDPPAWLTKNADATCVAKFVYEEPEVGLPSRTYRTRTSTNPDVVLSTPRVKKLICA